MSRFRGLGLLGSLDVAGQVFRFERMKIVRVPTLLSASFPTEDRSSQLAPCFDSHTGLRYTLGMQQIAGECNPQLRGTDGDKDSGKMRDNFDANDICNGDYMYLPALRI
ncbi:hypothetical protein KM043_004221 [Ampulex compressa]|nr:hypothetical protein KM043_004221 [Ampulex compressa]